MRSKKLQRYGIFMALLLLLILWRRSDASPDSWRGSSGKLPGWEQSKLQIDVNTQSISLKPLVRQIRYAVKRVDHFGANESFLFIWNLGKTPLDVNLNILPAHNFSNKTNPVPKIKKASEVPRFPHALRDLLRHRTQQDVTSIAEANGCHLAYDDLTKCHDFFQYNITAYVEQNSSIVLNGGEGKLCVINMTSPLPSPPLIPPGSEEKSSQAGSTLYTTSTWNASKNVAAAAKCSAWSNSSCSSKNLTACPYPDSDAASITSLLVQNGKDNPLTVDITLLPANTNLSQVKLPEKEWQMVNVTDKLGTITSIRLSSGDGLCDCEFIMVSESNTPKQFSYVGVLLFICGVVILAAALAYWKLRAATSRANGIAYEQLERGMANTSSTGGGTSQTAGGGWDQSWGDDDWDEVKTVKSPRSVQKGNVHANSIKDD